MITTVEASRFLVLADNMLLVDVRSPSEYRSGHIPGAENIPLFTDEERARVGTLYKKRGKQEAVDEGLRISGPNMVNYVSRARELLTRKKKLCLYCWRGGERSASMAWLFSKAGIAVTRLEGGYKAYRRYLKRALSQPGPLLILGGMTGSGKTKILEALASSGEQVINLEGLAAHRGSVFGGYSNKGQPSTEYFENLIFDQWRRLDHKKILWLEDESKSIGRVFIPDELFLPMKKSPLIEILLPEAFRIQNIVAEYSLEQPDMLMANTYKIEKRLGGENTKACIAAIEKKDFHTAVSLLLRYYDKAYRMSMNKNKREQVLRLSLQRKDPVHNAKTILKVLQENNSFSKYFV